MEVLGANRVRAELNLECVNFREHDGRIPASLVAALPVKAYLRRRPPREETWSTQLIVCSAIKLRDCIDAKICHLPDADLG